MKQIIVEHLSKTYEIDAYEKRDMSFRELLLSQASALFRRKTKQSTFYALNDVSFDVEQGEVLGIIGKNGSGKSTLLKILSKITTPTSGQAIIRGRVSSLLEVGTGFHAELTGRENIYLSGVILGMRRWEVSQKFDEIVAFSGIEKFLEIPVKKYSSGMRLRLAFSIAAHLRSQILLIDEVLAVGDYEFEKKCIDSMGALGKEGRTIIFVSHQLQAVRKLCSRVMVLAKGQQQFMGVPADAIKTYLGVNTLSRSSMLWGQDGLALGSVITLYAIKVVNTSLQETEQFNLDEKVTIEVAYEVLDKQKELLAILFFYDETGTLLFSTSHLLYSHSSDQKAQKTSLFCSIPDHIFQEGTVSVGLSIFNRGNEGEMMDFDAATVFAEKEIVSFTMRQERHNEFMLDETFWQDQKGKIKPRVTWHMRS